MYIWKISCMNEPPTRTYFFVYMYICMYIHAAPYIYIYACIYTHAVPRHSKIRRR